MIEALGTGALVLFFGLVLAWNIGAALHGRRWLRELVIAPETYEWIKADERARLPSPDRATELAEWNKAAAIEAGEESVTLLSGAIVELKKT